MPNRPSSVPTQPGGMEPTALKSLVALCASLLLSVSTTIHARAFTSEVVGDHTLRCSTTRTDSLPDEILDRYGVRNLTDAGILSCVIQRQDSDGQWRNQRGSVTARAGTITGVYEELPIREILGENEIGYIATYELPSSGPLKFDVLVELEPSDRKVRIEFDDLQPRQ